MSYHFGILGCVISIARQGGGGTENEERLKVKGERLKVNGQRSTDNRQQSTDNGQRND